MKVYTLQQKQFLPISIQEAWEFFSSPKNLARITPVKIDFKILHISGNEKMYAGQIIRYKVCLRPFYSIHWVTEITHVNEPNYFVDDQRFGPFTFWHHQHFFNEVSGGVEMTDEVSYAIPFGWFGRLANWLFVGREVNTIFEHRFTALEKYFQQQKSDKI